MVSSIGTSYFLALKDSHTLFILFFCIPYYPPAKTIINTVSLISEYIFFSLLFSIIFEIYVQQFPFDTLKTNL